MMGGKVLLIENDEDCLEIISCVLTSKGLAVEAFSEPDILSNSVSFDIIILDEMLEGTRGSVICSALKTHPEKHLIPVVLISAVENLDEIAADCKADAYLKKPFALSDLEKLIDVFLPPGKLC